MKMNKKAVSAIIGVILMVAITVAIAATVFVYVENLRQEQEQEQEQEPLYVEGWVVDAYDTQDTYNISGENYSVWKICLGSEYDTPAINATVYYMIFTHGMSPPSEGVHLRLFYTVEDTYLDVNNVESL